MRTTDGPRRAFAYEPDRVGTSIQGPNQTATGWGGVDGSTNTVCGVVAAARVVPAVSDGSGDGRRICALTLAVELVDVPAGGLPIGVRPGDPIDIWTPQTDLALLEGGRLTATITADDRDGVARLWLVDILSAARAC